MTISPNELRRIVASADEAARDGVGAALATVVAVVGSSYRRAGARMLVRHDGRVIGGVSGGCLEADVVRKALLAIVEQRPALLHYDTSDDEDGSFGLGCRGEIEILVEPLASEPAQAQFRSLRQALTSRRPIALAARFGERSLLVERLSPLPRLLVVGAGPDVEPLAACADALGYEVMVIDERPGYLGRRRLPDGVARAATSLSRFDRWKLDEHTACVVATHNASYDTRALRFLLATAAQYIGVIGPRKRTEKLFADLGSSRCDRVYSPAGLDIGGATPEQVGLAILAEIDAVRNGRAGGFLRHRDRPIHDDSPAAPQPEEAACRAETASPA
ncbi:MAG: alanine dehydrogenase [bacterium]|nr:alanine dehydrogenase [bacterium]